jgi:hypothetical protein
VGMRLLSSYRFYDDELGQRFSSEQRFFRFVFCDA